MNREILFIKKGEKEMRLGELIKREDKKLSPLRDPFELFRQEIESIFNRSVRSSLVGLDLDVCDTGKEIIIKADVPGLEEKDMSLNLTKDIITIQGEKRREEKKEDDNYYLRERSYGSFSRSVQLPFQADPDDIEAALDKGILTITVKKPKEAQDNPKKIKINS